MHRKYLAALVCAALSAVAAVSSTLAPDSAQAATAIGVATSPSNPWPGESVRLAGKVPPRARPVVLQKLAGGRWVGVTSAKAGVGGAFAFRVRATSSRTTYRIVASRVRISGKVYDARVSGLRLVQGRSPSVGIAFAPAPVGQQVSGDTYRTPGRVRIAPARPGAAVTVQRQDASGWTTVASGVQDAGGVLGFQLVPGTSSYRALARTPGSTVQTPSASVRAPAWSRAWQDEMVAPTWLNPSSWAPRGVGDRGERRVCSTTGENQVSYGVAGGVSRMQLTFSKDVTPFYPATKCPHGTFRNAMVGTAGTKSFVYGVFAARVRFQSPRGMHGAFWLQSDGTPEIDTAEYFGDGRSDGGLASFLHPRSTTQTSVGGVQPRAKAEFARQRTTPSAGYHVYSVEWTAGAYVFRVDGVETLRSASLRSADPHYLVLSLLGSDWELAQLPRTSTGQHDLSKAAMDVDWVRVWQAPTS